MKIGYLLCGENILLDARSNSYSIFNILEMLNSVTFPFMINKIEILALFEKEENEPDAVTVEFIINNNGEEISKDEIEIEFSEKSRTRTLFSINGLPINNPGVLEIIIKYQNNELGRYKIEINKIGKPEIKVKFESSGSGVSQ